MNAMDSIVSYQAIGIIHTKHKVARQTPIQSVFAQECFGWIELRSEYVDGLMDLEGFSHLHLIYHLHEAGPARMHVTPFLDTQERGLFATRHPCRPNPIGLSLVELLAVEGAILHLKGVDILDGSPLLDIKPYVPRFDCRPYARGGWNDAVDDDLARQRGVRDFKPKPNSE